MSPREELENLDDMKARNDALAQMSAVGDAGPMDEVQPADSFSVGNDSGLPPESMDRVQVADSKSTDSFGPLPSERQMDRTWNDKASVTKIAPRDDSGSASSILGALGRGLTAFGGGDIGAYDKNRSDRENAPFVAERRRREQLDYDETRADKQAARAAARARLDPTSPESKEAQDNYIRSLASYAKIPGIPEGIANELKSAADGAPKMSAAHIDRAFPALKDLLGTALKGAGIEASRDNRVADLKLKERGVAAQEAMVPVKAADITADNQRQGAMLGETIRHNKATEEGKANPPLKVKLPDAKTLADYRTGKIAADQTREAIKLLPQVRYTGAGAERVNNILGVLPDGMDVRNDAERKVSALVSKLRALSRNKIYGAALSKYDIADANSFLANLGNNPKTFKTNLETALKALDDMNAMIAEQYPSISGDKIPGAPDKGGSPNPNVERAKAILADPNESPEKKAKAEKWLKANQ